MKNAELWKRIAIDGVIDDYCGVMGDDAPRVVESVLSATILYAPFDPNRLINDPYDKDSRTATRLESPKALPPFDSVFIEYTRGTDQLGAGGENYHPYCEGVRRPAMAA